MSDPRSYEFWSAEEAMLGETISPLVSRSLLAGAAGAADALPVSLQVLIDWDIFNQQALDYLRRYRLGVVRGINETTRNAAVRAIDDWVQSGERLDVLQDRLGLLFNKTRANRIAVTEVTRIFAEGNLMTWKATGLVEGKRWMTAVDERVCPICGPMHGTIVELNADWDLSEQATNNPELAKAIASLKQSRFTSPPAHVNCRCYLQPVVFEAMTEEEIAEGSFDPTLATRRARAQEIALIEGMGFDPFEDIRPPSGRAPRGMGEEYRQRRRIVSRIETQMKWRSHASAQLNRYRGQRANRWQIDMAQARYSELNKGIDAMLNIASQPMGDWQFKGEMVDGIIGYLQSLR